MFFSFKQQRKPIYFQQIINSNNRNKEINKNYFKIKKTTNGMKIRLNELSRLILFPQSSTTTQLIQDRIHIIEDELTNLENLYKESDSKINELINNTIPSLQEDIHKNHIYITNINKVLDIRNE